MVRAEESGPRLVVLCGLPGVGKSTVGELVVERLDALGAEARLLRTDVIRKELVAEPTYSDAETERVYLALFERAREALDAGQWAVLDGTFRDRPLRDRAADTADDAEVEPLFVKVTCEESVAMDRIRERTDDESDAEIEEYDHFREIFDPLERDHVTVDNSGERAETRERVADLF
jgi:predicted kinase